MSETTSPSTPESRLLRLAATKQNEKLDVAWMAAIEDPAGSLDEFVGVMEILARRGDSERAETLFWMLLMSLIERKGPDEAVRVIVAARPFLPESAALREEIAKIYRAARKDFPHIKDLLLITVSNKDVPLRAAVEALEKFMTMPCGCYVLDRDTLKPGLVEGVMIDRRAIGVRFEKDVEFFDPSSFGRLEKLPPDDFRARAVFEREELQSLAREAPTELLALALAAFGGRLEYGPLKMRLGGVIGQSEWARWWAAAKVQLKRSTTIEMTAEAQPMLILRKKEITFSGQVSARFEVARSLEEKLDIVLEYLDVSAREKDPDLDFHQYLADSLSKSASGGAGVFEIGALAVVSVLRARIGAGPDAAKPLEGALGRAGDLSELLLGLRSERLAEVILDACREQAPERWTELFEALFAGASAKSCERVALDLIGADREDLLEGAIGRVLEKPERFVFALVWLWKAQGRPQFSKVFERYSPVALALRLFSVLNSLGRLPGRSPLQQEHLSQLRKAISGGDFSSMRDLVNSSPAEQVRSIYDGISRCGGLSEQAQAHLLDMIIEIHPTLLVRKLYPWEEDVVYTTEAGLRRFEQDYEHLIHSKIADNARSIGEAASLGDLAENAEWTAALETRDRLTERAGRMRADLTKAHVIPPDMPDSPSVTVGSRVKVKELSTGEVQTFSFLGPWDADAEKGIYSYRAPLSQAFMGKAAGQTASFTVNETEQRWEILEVGSGIKT